MSARMSLATGLMLLAWQPALADSIEFSSSVRRVTALEASDGAPAGGIVYEHFVTTDGDILSVGFVETAIISGELFDHPLSSAGDAPHPGLFDYFPGLSADSYITTPGDTLVLGTGLPADGDDTFGDTGDDGAQTDFQFAQLTFSNGGGVSLSGQVAIAGSAGVYSETFSFLDFPIFQTAYLDSYPADGSDISLNHPLVQGSSVVATSIVISAVGPNGAPFEIHEVTVSNDEQGIFSAAANGSNIDLKLNMDAAQKQAGGTLATAELLVTTNSGDLNFTLSAVIPEPSTGLLLMVAGVLSLVVTQRSFNRLMV